MLDFIIVSKDNLKRFYRKLYRNYTFSKNSNIEEANSCCFCLFGNQKNDFFREHRLHSSSGGGGGTRKSLPQSQNDAGGEGADDVIEIGDNKRPSLFEKLMGKQLKNPKGKNPPKTETIAAVESSKLTSSNSLMAADDNQVFEQNNTHNETINTTNNNNNISTIPSVNEIEKTVQTVPDTITQDQYVDNTTPKFTLVMNDQDQNVPNNESELDELRINTEPATNIDSSIVQNTDNKEAMNVDENYTDKNIEDASLNG